MSQEGQPENDDLHQFFEEADRVARRSRSEQLEWLEKLRDLNADLPNIDDIVRHLDSHMQLQHKIGTLSAEKAYHGERMEAKFMEMLDELLSAPDSDWEDSSDDHLRGVAQIAVLSHLIDPLRERCQEPAAQDRLVYIFEKYLLVREDDQ